MLTAHAISLFILCIGVLIVGLIKPKWILFWVEKPNRLMISAVSMVLFMIAAVLFGEGLKQKKLAEQQQPAPVTADKPVIQPEAKPAQAVITPAIKPATAPAQAPGTSANDLRP
jgi:hypothetical protein